MVEISFSRLVYIFDIFRYYYNICIIFNDVFLRFIGSCFCKFLESIDI